MAHHKKLKEGNTAISLEKAQEWVKKWKDPKEQEGRKKVDSYLIPMQNLALVLGQGIDAARAYVGINEKGDQTLMLVGTRYNKETHIYEDLIPGYDDSDAICAIPFAIYDFSEASPPAKADPKSPLND